MCNERNTEQDLDKLADAFFDNLMIDDCEFGGIGLDSKRPFGNSDVETDMCKIIGMKPEWKCPDCGESYSTDQQEYVEDLYMGKLIPYLKKRWKNPDQYS